MMIETSQVVIPSDPATQKRIRDACAEFSASATRVEGEKDFQKELISSLAEDTDLPKKYLRKLCAVYHKQNLAEVEGDAETISEIYNKVFGDDAS
jgi:hypothetical protein